MEPAHRIAQQLFRAGAAVIALLSSLHASAQPRPARQIDLEDFQLPDGYRIGRRRHGGRG